MPSKKDKELIAAATAAIGQRYRNDWQEVGAAMRTRDGRIVTGVNIDAYIGRIAVCAEAIAIGRAITETGDHGIETIVAVRRELIHDYDAKARVIVPDNGKAPKVVTIGELLPNKYKRGTE
jgi:cytidine deaminase